MQTSDAQKRASWRALLWRVHAWSALIASPFLLMATLTGLLYVGTPQIERALHGHMDRIDASGRAPPRLALEQSVIAAIEAAPHGMQIKTVIAPSEADASVVVLMTAPNPSSGNPTPMPVTSDMAPQSAIYWSTSTQPTRRCSASCPSLNASQTGPRSCTRNCCKAMDGLG